MTKKESLGLKHQSTRPERVERVALVCDRIIGGRRTYGTRHDVAVGDGVVDVNDDTRLLDADQ
jgi:hypothetical protein